MASRSSDGPLEGLRVLDLGEAFAGPLGASLLGEFGAEVIKIEPPGIGNNMRSFPPFHNGASLWWALEGRNKKSITVDMRQAKGQEIIQRLVRISDVVVENFRAGTLERWNLGYEELRQINPGIILFRATGFGQESPYNHLPSYDTIGSAMGGLTYLTGSPDRPPLRTGLAVCDYLSASFNALGILLSLYHRGKTGLGQWAELGQYEVIFRLSGPLAAAYDRLGLVPERTGNQHPWVAPYGIFETKDGRWVAVAAVEDREFARLAEALGDQRLLRQPRYATLAGRAECRQEIHQAVAEWVKGHFLEEVVRKLVENEVAVSPVHGYPEIFQDPHCQARGDLIEVEDPVLERVKMPNVFPRLSLTPGRVRHSGPALGQHTEEILSGLLGYSLAEIEDFKADGIIRPRPAGKSQQAKSPSASKTSLSAPSPSRDNRIAASQSWASDPPLKGLRVLQVGGGLAGPFGATLLGDFGAEVIAVEEPGKGDLLRQLPPFCETNAPSSLQESAGRPSLDGGSSLWWAVEARNKRSITLDLRMQEGQELFRRLVAVSDVVIDSLRPGTLEGWGLGYEALKSIRERIIMVRVSGYGQEGPYSRRPAYEIQGAALCGLANLTGFPDGPPTRLGFEICAYFAGLFAALGTLMALHYRDTQGTGKGQWIDLALYEPLLRFSHYNIPSYDKLGFVEERLGNIFLTGAPIDFFKTRDDQYVVIVCGHDTVFSRLCRAIGREELAHDPRFATNAKRAENRDLTNGVVAEWVGAHSVEEVLAAFNQNEVPASTIYSIREIFEDPCYRAREDILEVEDPALGRVKMSAVLPRLSLTPGKVKSAGPALGQHNGDVYGGLLGLSEEEIEELERAGVL